MAELPASLRRLSLPMLAIACLLQLPTLVVAQDSANYCEASAAIKEEFKKLSAIDDVEVPYKVRRERQLVILQDLLKKYPDDFFVQRRYQMARLTGLFIDRPALNSEYRAQMEKDAKDPKAIFLYARALTGRRTKEAIQLLNKLAQESPDFPWTHMQLAEIYAYPNFRNAAKSKEHLKLWVTKCPGTTVAAGMISRGGDKEMMAAAAQSLRSRLESSTDIDDLQLWATLWSLEFKLKPVTEHEQVRKQLADDLKRIREKNQNTKQQLAALREGYKQVGDKTSQRWAEDEVIRVFPKSATARSIVQTRYTDENPYPKGDAPEAEHQAANKARAQVSAEWVKRWPDDEWSWSSYVRSLAGWDGSANDDVEAAYKGYVKAHEQAGGYSIPPVEVSVARVYLRRGFRLESIPEMVQKGIAEVERLEKDRSASDLYPGDSEGGNLKFTRIEALPLMAEAYARIKQPAKAREVLAQLYEITKPKVNATAAQKRGASYGLGVYWQTVGKVAEFEQRKLDALSAYQTAAVFRTPKPGAKDELSDKTNRLWKELGGTDQGWQAYLARTEAAKSKLATAETATWDPKDTALPEFELMDLEGRKWSLADIKGKVAFINLWATWCGPCRLELPYVQKLREQMKNKKDVLILTLNTDEEVGKVDPFMKENKYTFPVLLGQAYSQSQGVNSIPRNWIVSADGKIMFEGIGFGNDGEEWMKKAVAMIEKAKGAK
jgi:thiol-disulfide isomerase/thioredoxin